MEILRTGPWARVLRELQQGASQLPQAIEKSLAEEAQLVHREVVRGIRDQAPGGRRFRRLAASTRAMRRVAGFSGSQALIRSGETVAAIRVISRRGGAFVGIPKNARGSDGRPLARILRMNEEGATIQIRMTPAMRRFLHSQLSQRTTKVASRGVIRVRIPARPVFGPVAKKVGNPRTAGARMLRRVQGRLPPIFGR